MHNIFPFPNFRQHVPYLMLYVPYNTSPTTAADKAAKIPPALIDPAPAVLAVGLAAALVAELALELAALVADEAALEALDTAPVAELPALPAEELAPPTAPLVAEAEFEAAELLALDEVGAELDAATGAIELPAIAEEKSASIADFAALA